MSTGTGWRNLVKTLLPSAVVPVVLAFLLGLYYQHVSWVHEPLHALLEAVGALTALLLAVFILMLRSNHYLEVRYIWVATALMAMGLLDGFHAAVSPGESFVWLHSLATFAGGVAFVMLLLPDRLVHRQHINSLPYSVAAVVTVVALLSLVYAESVPRMLEAGEFTLNAKALNMIGGAGFIIAWLVFVFGDIRAKQQEKLFLANHTLLFGTAAILFEFSVLWDMTWWLWHVLRLLAYLIVLWYFMRLYYRLAIESRLHEIRFRNLVESTSDWIWEIDENDRFTYVSPKVKDLLGYEPDDLMGKSAIDLMTKDEAKKVNRLYRDLIRQHLPFSGMVNINLHKDGHEVILESSGVPLFDNRGKWTGYRGIDRDITTRINTEKALQHERDRALKIINTAPVIMLILNRDGTIDHVNPYFEQLTGYQLDEVRGKNWFSQFLPERDRESIRQLFLTSWTNAPVRANVNAILTHDGRELEIEWYDNLFTDENGVATSLLAIGQDITERKQIERQLARAAVEWNYAMDFFDDAIYLIDNERRLVRANKAFYEMVHTREPDVIGRPIADILHPEGEAVLCPVCQAQEDKRDAVIIMEPNQPDNPLGVPVEVTCRVIHDEEGMPVSILMTIHDLTHSRRAAEEVHHSQALLSEAQRIGHMGNWNWNVDSGQLQWSDEIYRIFGLDPQQFEVTYDAFLETVHPDDRKLVEDAVKVALSNGTTFSIDHRIVRPDGSVRFVHERGELRLGQDARPLDMTGTVQDITERKLSEQALISSEQRFRAIFNQAAVGIAQVAPDGRFLLVNSKLCDITGYPADELTKLNFQQITHQDMVQAEIQQIEQLLSGELDTLVLEKRYTRKDHALIWVTFSVSLVRKTNGKPDYFIAIVEDINDRKAAEAMIKKNLHEKDVLLQELHHRVKNNMQVISSILSIQSRYLSAENALQAFTDSRQRIRAISMIHDRLYSASDLASIDFKQYLVYLGERITRLHESSNRKININVEGDTIHLSIDSALPCALIVNELFTNAIKHAYAEIEDVVIDVRLEMVDDTRCRIEVRDHGCGFEAEQLIHSPGAAGFLIMKALVNQLGADFKHFNDRGSVFRLEYALRPWLKTDPQAPLVKH